MNWKTVLKDGFFPLWPTEHLERLLVALQTDDIRLTQGSTTTPPPLMSVQDWPCEACCLVAFGSTEDPFNSTVGEVEKAFAKACFDADSLLGAPAACRHLLNAFDDAPRGEIFRELAAEVKAELGRRA